jgi:hypothetical protein
MELAIVELDTGAEFDATECAEVDGVELVGGTNLGGGRGMWMERGRDRRHKYGARGARLGGGSASERLGQNPSWNLEPHNIERRERCGRVDEDEPQGPDGKSRERRGRVDEDEPRPDGKSRVALRRGRRQ